MFQGYNKPSKRQIFGPSATGGTWADTQGSRKLYMTGEGLGSFFSSIFRKIVPLASKAVKKVMPVAKKIASSNIVQETGRQLLDSGVDAMTNVAVNAISGDKSVGESVSEELTNARQEISSALKKANQKRKASTEKDSETAKKRKTASKRKAVKKGKKKSFRRSVFDDDDD